MASVFDGVFGQQPSTSTSAPVYSPDLLALQSFLSNQVLKNQILPLQKQQIGDWGNIGRGAFDMAPNIMDPAMSAGRQAQSQYGAMTSDLPANISAPLQESMAQETMRTPRRLQTMAPGQLQDLVKALIDPQFAGLLNPSTASTSQTGGASDVSTGLSIGSTLDTLFKIYGLFSGGGSNTALQPGY